MESTILNKAKDIQEWVIAQRRDFHMNPELSHKEFRTTKRIKEELEKMGIETLDIGETGAVGIIHGKEEGKVVGLRADIDALPVLEDSGVEYSSLNEGAMHACGHDTHASMLLGAAKVLSEMRNEFKGTIKLIFQPAEETALGAKQVIDAGIMENPDIDAIVGMHIFTDFPIGTAVIQEGSLMASADLFSIEIYGTQCHGSAPWQGVDANMCAVAITQALQTIVSRNNDARIPLVLNVGTIQAGERFNITSGKAVLGGSTRTFDEETRKKLPIWMEKIISGICIAYGCEYKFEYDFLISATINDVKTTKQVRMSASSIIGEKNVLQTGKIMGSEDFSEYQKLVPGTMILLGANNQNKGCIHPIHSNHFKIDEDALIIGVALYAQSAIDLLK
ncbi:MAG: M20 family metallopeptidase [Bacteroidales bacterium]